MKVRAAPEGNKLEALTFGIFGPSGGGKTTLAAGLNRYPATAPTMWVDYVGNPERVQQEGLLDFVWVLDSPDELLQILDWLNKGQPKNHPFAVQYKDFIPETPYKSFVLDTVTEWQHKLIEEITGADLEKLMRMGLKKVGSPTAMEHGQAILQGTMFVARQIKALPMPKVLIFQEQETIDFSTGATQRQLDLYGKSRNRMLSVINLAGRVSWVDTGKEIVEEEIGGKKRKIGIDTRVQKISFLALPLTVP